MPEGQKRIGRPPKPATEGKKVSLGLKVTPRIKDRLDQAARASGRTQSQEAEYRLEQTFDQRPLLAAMELAFGRELGGILIVIGDAMRSVLDCKQWVGHAGAPDVKALEHPWWYDNLVHAAAVVLEAFRPPGEIDDVRITLWISPENPVVAALAAGTNVGEHIAYSRLREFSVEGPADAARSLMGEGMAVRVADRSRRFAPTHRAGRPKSK